MTRSKIQSWWVIELPEGIGWQFIRYGSLREFTGNIRVLLWTPENLQKSSQVSTMTTNGSVLSGHGPNYIVSTPSTITKYAQDPIAIIGMACRLPGDSNSPHKLWEFLEKGGVAQNDAPASRFNLKAHHDGSKKPKTMRSPGGMFLENVDPQDFDAPFFGISRTDAIAMDPQQRQLLEVVYECLENAGLRMDDLDRSSVGCFVGSYAVGMTGPLQNRTETSF